MGIFDEAIREHLELKRQHGAGDSELRELEDDAFGPAARPGEAAAADAPAALDTEAPTELAALQELPDLGEPAVAEAEIADVDAAPPDLPEIEEPPPTPDAGTVAIETEEHPPPEGVAEPEIPDPEEEPAASITEQPTELYDPEDADAAPGTSASEAPYEPVEDEFFSEQSLSDELDQALDAPEGEEPPAPEDGVSESPAPEQGVSEPPAPEEVVSEEPEEGEDVLEETPEFLQDTPEHDRLWFEQRPPKDFDFDD